MLEIEQGGKTDEMAATEEAKGNLFAVFGIVSWLVCQVAAVSAQHTKFK